MPKYIFLFLTSILFNATFPQPLNIFIDSLIESFILSVKCNIEIDMNRFNFLIIKLRIRSISARIEHPINYV